MVKFLIALMLLGLTAAAQAQDWRHHPGPYPYRPPVYLNPFITNPYIVQPSPFSSGPGRYWNGTWYAYGTAPCWQPAPPPIPPGTYSWVCG